MVFCTLLPDNSGDETYTNSEEQTRDKAHTISPEEHSVGS